MDSPTSAKKPPPLPFSGAIADQEEEDWEGEGEAERATVPPPRRSGQPRSSDPPCPRRREGNEARGVRRIGAGAEEGEAVSSHGRVGAGRGAHSGGAVVRAPEAAAAGARQCAPEAAAARAGDLRSPAATGAWDGAAPALLTAWWSTYSSPYATSTATCWTPHRDDARAGKGLRHGRGGSSANRRWRRPRLHASRGSCW